MAVSVSSGCEILEAYSGKHLFCLWEYRFSGGALCQAVVALVALAPAVRPWTKCVVSALRVFILGLRPKGQQAAWQKLFSRLCHRHREGHLTGHVLFKSLVGRVHIC